MLIITLKAPRNRAALSRASLDKSRTVVPAYGWLGCQDPWQWPHGEDQKQVAKRAIHKGIEERTGIRMTEQGDSVV